MELEKIVCTSCGSVEFDVIDKNTYICKYCKTMYKLSSDAKSETTKKICSFCKSDEGISTCMNCGKLICSFHSKMLDLKELPDLYERFGNYKYCPECYNKINKRYPFVLKLNILKKISEKIISLKKEKSNLLATAICFILFCAFGWYCYYYFELSEVGYYTFSHVVFEKLYYMAYYAEPIFFILILIFLFIFLIIFIIFKKYLRCWKKMDEFPIIIEKTKAEIEEIKEKFIEEYGKDSKKS